MNDALSNDENEALAQIRGGSHGARPSACVARNVKRLAGLKYVSYRKDGVLLVTEKGEQTLFIRRCIDGMRAVALNSQAALDPDVRMFLGKKGHVAAHDEGGLLLTERGRESLDDIDRSQS